MKKLLFLFSFVGSAYYANTQCNPDPANIYAFSADGISYEIIKENLNWTDAAACAVNRGGFLTEINTQLEEDSIFHFVNLAGIIASNTDAPDGGGAAYLWIGGNDLTSEGVWVWDGNNDATSTQFWQGTSTGTSVGGLYNNWGDEPDDFSGQDALGFAFNNWPYGVAGEWNDVDQNNTLYFIIEYPNTNSIKEENDGGFLIYPNPSNDIITIQNSNQEASYSVQTIEGRTILSFDMAPNAAHSIQLQPGIYLIRNSVTGVAQKIIVS